MEELDMKQRVNMVASAAMQNVMNEKFAPHPGNIASYMEINNNEDEGLQGQLKQHSATTKQLLAAKVGQNVRKPCLIPILFYNSHPY